MGVAKVNISHLQQNEWENKSEKKWGEILAVNPRNT